MFKNKLSGYYGNENLTDEFKELCLKISVDLFLTQEEIEEIFEKKIWNEKLLEPIKKTIDIYLSQILKKYISSFTNSNINGKFIIGIDDYGEITGIPFTNDLSKEDIENTVRKTINELLILPQNDNSHNLLTNSDLHDIYNIHNVEHFNTENKESQNKLFENINIELIKLDIDDILITDEYSELYNQYKSSFMDYNDKMSIYQNERIKWLLNLDKYSTKLSILINSTETRQELIQYINDNLELKKLQSIEKGLNIDNSKIKNIIKILETETYVPIPSFEPLQIRKVDPNDIMFWLVQFKDDMTNKICLLRPEKPNFKRIYNPFQIISKLSFMRSVFSKIEGINYYIIKININGHFINNTIYYNDQHKWIKKFRKETLSGNPYSE